MPSLDFGSISELNVQQKPVWNKSAIMFNEPTLKECVLMGASALARLAKSYKHLQVFPAHLEWINKNPNVAFYWRSSHHIHIPVHSAARDWLLTLILRFPQGGCWVASEYSVIVHGYKPFCCLLCSGHLQWNISGSFSLTECSIMDMTTPSKLKHMTFYFLL